MHCQIEYEAFLLAAARARHDAGVYCSCLQARSTAENKGQHAKIERRELIEGKRQFHIVSQAWKYHEYY